MCAPRHKLHVKSPSLLPLKLCTSLYTFGKHSHTAPLLGVCERLCLCLSMRASVCVYVYVGGKRVSVYMLCKLWSFLLQICSNIQVTVLPKLLLCDR